MLNNCCQLSLKCLNSFPPEPLHPLPPDATFWRLPHFPDDDFLRLVYSAVIWACLFCLYTTITAQVAPCILTVHDCIILVKLDITWFTCVINKTKPWVNLLKFKMAARCTRCVFGFKIWVLGFIFTMIQSIQSAFRALSISTKQSI